MSKPVRLLMAVLVAVAFSVSPVAGNGMQGSNDCRSECDEQNHNACVPAVQGKNCACAIGSSTCSQEECAPA